MRPLPWDYARCAPQEVDKECHTCRRWLSHPNQSNNPYMQACVTVKNSNDERCRRIPVSLTEEEK